MSVRPFPGVSARGDYGLDGIFRCAGHFYEGKTGEARVRYLGRPGWVAFRPHLSQNHLTNDFLRLLDNATVISGGTDLTFPNMSYVSSAGQSNPKTKALEAQIGETSVSRWYAENLSSSHPIFSPIPGGVPPSPFRGSVSLVRTHPKRNNMTKLALCAHRVRAGGDFDERRKVTLLAQGAWASFAEVLPHTVGLREFRRTLRSFPFSFCVQGGGLDPSPKVFEALRQGSIPIIKDSPLADAYRHFPVLVVDSWTADCLSQTWLEEMDQKLRSEWSEWFSVIERTSMSYWSGLIAEGRDTRLIPPRKVSPRAY